MDSNNTNNSNVSLSMIGSVLYALREQKFVPQKLFLMIKMVHKYTGHVCNDIFKLPL